MISTKCPNCGATMEFDETRDFCFCQFCGTKVVPEKIVIEHKGSISVDGISTLNNTLERAEISLRDGYFEKAKGYFNKALDINPRCAQAYWGLLLCKYQAKNDADLVDKTSGRISNIENIPEYKNSLKYADKTQLNRFLSTRNSIKRNEDAVYSRIKELFNEIDDIKSLCKKLRICKLVSLAATIVICIVCAVILFPDHGIGMALRCVAATAIIDVIIIKVFNSTEAKNNLKIKSINNIITQLKPLN